MTNKNAALIGQGFAHSENSQNDINELSFAEMLPIIQSNINGQLVNSVSAKSLHEALGVGRDFSTWIDGRIAEYSFIKDVDFFTFDSPKRGNQSAESEQWKSRRGGDRRSKDYFLSLNMAKELGMVERTEQGRLIRQYFIKCEEALHKVAPALTKQLRNELKSRLKVANYFKPMCSALELARIEQGKTTLPRHYTNESNMLNRIVLAGLTAKQWAKQHGVIGEPRDAMSELQLEHLSSLEQTNTTLIELGMDYHARKDKLTGLSQKWLAQRVEAN
ncbi:antA/AntB antirepressor family protein [Photorhabdus heterorhabditis]|uniref:AntA/AntB antirepressor family protein n=1 Tax=Photorhabdus heterorhabditis TaxID=880156 RepID=A0ABR5KA88_9GAMM|nr:antA/AntB antirepressor family protein [Photorhabdus heterorhabditis]KOY61348.1 antA/AntB antirepressor family protein [Photorhabdus heterorhabditis]